MVESFSFTYSENEASPKSEPSKFIFVIISFCFLVLNLLLGFIRLKLVALSVICTSVISSTVIWSRKISCSLRMATSVWQTLVSAKRTCTTVLPPIHFVAPQRLVGTLIGCKTFAVFSARNPAKKAVHAVYWLVVPRGSHLRDGVRVAAVLLDQRRRNVPGHLTQTVEAEKQCKCWDARLLVKDFGEEPTQSPGPRSRRLVPNSKSRFLQIDQLLRFTTQKVSPGLYSSCGKFLFKKFANTFDQLMIIEWISDILSLLASASLLWAKKLVLRSRGSD